MRALVVDGNPLVMDFIVRELAPDFEILAARGGHEALTRLNLVKSLDLMVCELHLRSTLNGGDLLRCCRQLFPPCRRVLTYWRPRGSVEPPPECHDAERLLVKPIRPGFVADVVRDLFCREGCLLPSCSRRWASRAAP